jgi:hypothetical protein
MFYITSLSMSNSKKEKIKKVNLGISLVIVYNNMNFPVTLNNSTSTISISLIFALSMGKYTLVYAREVCQVFQSSHLHCYVIWLLSQATIQKQKVVGIWDKHILLSKKC